MIQAQIDDQVKITPVNPLSTQSNYELVRTNENTLRVRMTNNSRVFIGLFFFLGVGILYLTPTNGDYFTLILGLVFCIVGIVFFSSHFYGAKFDLNQRVFTTPYPTPSKQLGSSTIPFDTIQEIQILDKKVQDLEDSDEEFLAYELNLVLITGNRLNIFDSHSKRVICSEGQLLSNVIGVPLSENYDYIGA